MKSITNTIIFLILLSSTQLNAQINAITDTGDQVILNSDGTWKYIDQSVIENDAITENKTIFKKEKKASFLVKSKRTNVGVWINPKKWSFTKGKENEDSEFEFQLKGEDLYGMMIAEKMEIPLESLKEIVLDNAKEAAPDIKIVKEEYRTVNGIRVLMMQMNGTIQGIKFVYYGYYYSNSSGTVQLTTYTGQNLLNDYIEDIEFFLNGIVVP